MRAHNKSRMPHILNTSCVSNELNQLHALNTSDNSSKLHKPTGQSMNRESLLRFQVHSVWGQHNPDLVG